MVETIVRCSYGIGPGITLMPIPCLINLFSMHQISETVQEDQLALRHRA